MTCALFLAAFAMGWMFHHWLFAIAEGINWPKSREVLAATFCLWGIYLLTGCAGSLAWEDSMPTTTHQERVNAAWQQYELSQQQLTHQLQDGSLSQDDYEKLTLQEWHQVEWTK